MGVRGLYTYINKIPGSYRTVNIIEEIQKQKSKNVNPVIMINLWTMANHMKQDVKDVIVGSRLNKIERKFKEFLQKMKNAGAEMIFVFKKTQKDKDEDFIGIQEAHYHLGRELIDKITAFKDFGKLKSIYEEKMQDPNFDFPLNRSMMLMLTQVAQRYGKLHGMDTINNRSSTFQVQLANESKAVAIMGLNTHYIFYDGSWAFWSDADLDMDQMTIRQYNKVAILRYMRLTPEKAPLFVCLAGNLQSSEQNLKTIAQFFKPWTKRLMENVASYVDSQRYPLTDGSIDGIIRDIFGHSSPQILQEFKETMRLMDINENMKVISRVEPDVMERIKHDYANFAEEILENSPIYISPVFMDLRSSELKIHELVETFLGKTTGLLLKHQNDRSPRTAFVKKHDREQFKIIEVAPVIPDFDIPQLKDLVAGKMAQDQKFKTLLWLSGLPLTSDDLKSIPQEFTVDIIICLHLLKKESMSLSEAEVLMRSIVDVHQDNIPLWKYPKNVVERAFRLGFLHSNIFHVLHSCMAAVGLKEFQGNLKFDGRHFQVLFAGKANTGFDDSLDIQFAFQKLLKICRTKADDYDLNQQTNTSDFQAEIEYNVLHQHRAGDSRTNARAESSVKVQPGEYDEKIKKLLAESSFEECLKLLEKVEKEEKLSLGHLYMKTECLIMMEKYERAEEIISKSLGENPHDLEMLYLQGLKFYYECEIKQSISSFDAALKELPSLTKANHRLALARRMWKCIFTGFSQLEADQNNEARDLFMQGLKVDASNKNFNFLMLFNLGMANFKLKLFEEAFDNFSQALRIKENHAKCLYKRANVHFTLNQFEDCIIDCEESLKLEASEQTKKLMSSAKTSMASMASSYRKKSQEILEIAASASKSDVKKAFYRLSLIYHVDKHPLSTAVEKLKLNRKFREIKSAYDILK